MRLRLTKDQEAARVAALNQYEHAIAAIGRRGRELGCLPVYVDWTAFLGLGPGGECLWVDHDDSAGRVEPVVDLQALSTLVAQVRLIPGLEGLEPTRPAGREDCPQCQGVGFIKVGPVECGCKCGGLGWLPATLAEIGVEASSSAP
jgi:hypothetical protein